MSLNLLPSQAKFQMEKIRAIKLSRNFLKYLLIIFILVVALILSTEQAIKWDLKVKNSNYKKAVDDYLQLSNEIVTSQTLKYRAKLLSKVLNDRFEYSDAFEIVADIFDPSISVKDFDLKEKSYFIVTLMANDYEQMKSIESRVSQVNSGVIAEINKINVLSVSYSKSTLQWQVAVEVYLK